MPALATWTPEDGLLGAVAPLGLAVATGATALVVDLDPDGPSFAGDRSLADLVRDEPRRDDLAPARSGVAVLRNGGVDPSAAGPVVAAMLEGWPYLVLRLPSRPPPEAPPAPVVPIRVLLPADVFPWDGRPAVYQQTGWRLPRPGAGPVLPLPRAGTWAALLAGTRPAPDRWLRALRGVWGYPWA